MKNENGRQKMNLPNRLTLTRLYCVPLFLAAAMAEGIPFNILIAGIIFIFAMVTDLLDGKIARKRNLVTNFGKFWDPLADKLMTITALICLAVLKTDYILSTVICVTVLTRELIVTGLRMMASSEGGKVVAANIWGKLKTVFQCIYIGIEMFLLFFLQIELAEKWDLYRRFFEPALRYCGIAAGIIMMVLTIWSAWTYFKECKEYLRG